jgi:hypothetical protein
MNDDFIDPELARAKRREEKTLKAKQAQDDAVVQSIMASEAGRAWMHDKIESCGIFRPIFDQNPYVTYLNEGKRNVGLMLLADIMRACPATYVQMMQEQSSARSSDLDRADWDDDRNYDAAGRWIGTGDGPDDSPR